MIHGFDTSAQFSRSVRHANSLKSQIHRLERSSIQAAVLNGLGPFQIGDGSTHLKDSVIRSGAHVELGKANSKDLGQPFLPSGPW